MDLCEAERIKRIYEVDKMELFSGVGIPEVNEETNFWMIRAKRGFFYDEFVRERFIAIGWNSVKASELHDNITKEQSDALKEIIASDYEEKIPGTALNKCIKFCNEMKVNDMVMIVDKTRITFATVGEFFEEDKPEYTAEYEREIHNKIRDSHKGDEVEYECPYIKRRSITVIKEIKEEAFSPYLYKAIAVNRHSLSKVNDYASIILSNCFESYIYKGRLVLVFRVNKQEDISAIALADFISGSAKLVANDVDVTSDIVVKTAVHSLGDVILEIRNYVTSHGFYVMLLYVALFGGKAGNYELNSVVSCIKNAINHKYSKEKQELELKKLKAEGDLIEQQVIEKKLDNAKKEADLALSNAEIIVPQVINSSKSLEVDLNDAKIVDITRFIEQYKE